MPIDKFIGTKDDFYFPICNDCKHKLKDLTCRAFPNRIPDEILEGKTDHHFEYPGDNGIQFEPITK